MNTLGNRIKLLRGNQSQAAFSSLFGIPQVTLGNYERDRNEPRFELIHKICSHFEINVEWLLFGTGLMRPSDATLPPEQPAKIVQDAPTEQALHHPSCLRCAKLEEKLTLVEEERQRIITAFVESMQKNLALSEENGHLRLENLKTSQMLDTVKAMCKEYAAKLEAAEPSLFVKPQNIQSSEARNIE